MSLKASGIGNLPTREQVSTSRPVRSWLRIWTSRVPKTAPSAAVVPDTVSRREYGRTFDTARPADSKTVRTVSMSSAAAPY